MAYSCALISTPVGGIPEILENGENGLMVTPGNSEEIAKAIQYFFDNSVKCQEMGKKSYQKVIPFLPETVFKQLSNLYTQLLE
jgi:glycosyltransferase involved in cell wall biosynthesis